MALDLRYMRAMRGAARTWFFLYAIPAKLRGLPQFTTRNGKPMLRITESLHTADPHLARRRRDERIRHWDRQFRMLLEGPTEEDIQEEAFEVYQAALKEARSPDWRLQYKAERHTEKLDNEIAVHVHKEIRDYCQRIGVMLEPKTEPWRKVGLAFLQAKIAAGIPGIWLPLSDGRTIRSEDQHPTMPPVPKIEPPLEVADRAPPLPPLSLLRRDTETFSQAFDEYLRTGLDGTSADTLADYRRKVGVFISKMGDLPLTKITDHMAVDFLDRYLLGERKQKPMTRNRYAMLFSAVYKSAIRRKKATHNPFEDQRIKQAAVHYEPFTDQEISALFNDAKFEITPAKHKTSTALPWVSLISAYTGGRLEEIAQLKASNIKQTDGIWYFEFCHDGNGKTEAASRTVPMHPELINAGLLRYRDALSTESMLFPGLKNKASKPGKLGPKLGDAFSSWRKRLGIDRPGVNFHSFRHTIGDRLRKAGVQASDIAALLGHEAERITSRVYGHDGPCLRLLQTIVQKIKYGI